MRQVTDAEAEALLARFGSLQQHQRQDGQRSPHKPLLVLLALGRPAAIGSSELPWSAAESALGELIAEFGPPSRTSRAQSAAYPFTRLRNDQVWVLDQDVQMDLVRPLTSRRVTGRLDPSVESVLLARPARGPRRTRTTRPVRTGLESSPAATATGTGRPALPASLAGSWTSTALSSGDLPALSSSMSAPWRGAG